MGLDSIIFIFFLSIFFNYFLIKNYKFSFLKKIADNEFTKPQAFHKLPVIRSGGITILFFLLFFSIFHENKSDYYFSIIALSAFFFYYWIVIQCKFYFFC